MALDVIDSYDEYILRRSQGKPTIHWASAIGKTIADQFVEGSFLALYDSKSACDCYCFKVDSSSNIRVVSRLIDIGFNRDDCSYGGLLGNKKAQSWWKSVFFEDNGSILYDRYYDSFRVADDRDITFGDLLDQITSTLDHFIKKIAKYRADAIYVPLDFYRHLPLRYILQSRICKVVRVLPDIQLSSDESHYVLQQCKSDKDTILSLAGGLAVSQLLGGNHIIVHMPLDDESLSSHLIGSNTWNDVLVKASDFSYRVNDITFQIVKLDAQVDVFSNLFLSLSSGKWKKSILVDA